MLSLVAVNHIFQPAPEKLISFHTPFQEKKAKEKSVRLHYDHLLKSTAFQTTFLYNFCYMVIKTFQMTLIEVYSN